MSDASNKTEYEELTIDSVEGLQAFLQNLKAQYSIGLEQESEGRTLDSDKLDERFQAVRSFVRKLSDKVSSGETVTTRDAVELQSKYDSFVQVIHSSSIENKKEDKQETKASAIEVENERPSEIPEREPESLPRKLTIEPQTEDFGRRSGRLTIASDDQAVIDVKERMSVTDSTESASDETPKKKKKKRKRKKKQKTLESVEEEKEVNESQESRTTEHSQKLKLVITECRSAYQRLMQKYAKPSVTQEMLLEEVKEGIEHLELLAKKPSITPEQLAASAEVASHIKNALTAVSEAEVVEVPSEFTDANSIPIIVREKKSTQTHDRENTVSFVPSSVTVGNRNPVKRSVPKTLDSLPRPDDIHTSESLTQSYLTAPKYRQFITEHYSSPESFERILDATVTKMEATTIDHIERWLGDLPASAFHYIKDMTLLELAEFSDKGYSEIKSVLKAENIKYETFVLWQDLIDEMVQIIPAQPKMKFAQLFTLWMAEIAMQDEK